MTNDEGHKPEGAPERSPKAGVGAPSGVDGNGPKRSMMSRDGVYISTTDIVAEDNYIHDLNSYNPHYDGIQLHGGVTSDVTIRHNSVSEFPNINNWWA